LADRVENANTSAEIMFHFAPGLIVQAVDSPYPGVRMSNGDGQVAWLFSVAADRQKIKFSEGWISESYGTRVPGKIASFKLASNQENKTVILLPDHADVAGRIAKMLLLSRETEVGNFRRWKTS